MITGPLQGPHLPTPVVAHGLHALAMGLVALLIGTLVDRFVRGTGAASRPHAARATRPIGRLLRGLGRCHAAATTQVVCRLMSAALFG